MNSTKGEDETNIKHVLTSQSLQFELFNEEQEDFKTYRERLKNFLELKQLTGDDVETNALKQKY